MEDCNNVKLVLQTIALASSNITYDKTPCYSLETVYLIFAIFALTLLV